MASEAVIKVDERERPDFISFGIACRVAVTQRPLLGISDLQYTR